MRWKSYLRPTAILIIALLVMPCAWAGPRYKVLYNFQGGRDGLWPSAALVADAAGNLYGVTAAGGLRGGEGGGCGTVFELRRGKTGWVHKVLYRFPASATDGCRPLANLVFDATGGLYGTTYWGGDCNGLKCGTVFTLRPSSKGEWKETVLHRFAGGNDGEGPSSGLVLDAAGNLYGTTANGGGSSTDCPPACGTVYELTSLAGSGWSEQILHSFSYSDGASPSGLTFDDPGNLYGTAGMGGAYDEGVAFELSPNSGGGWNESTIYNFGGFQDGACPDGPLTFHGPNLYGATCFGGSGDYGTIFELKPGAKGWTHSVLYSFAGGKDGRYPGSPVLLDHSGNLYGTTSGDQGCAKGDHFRCGNVFGLKKQSGGQWKLQVLHSFTGGTSGSFPSNLIFHGEGKLFGVTFTGGNCTKGYGEYCGLAFEVMP
jgi:uncharacterized repeat protein (TIGR03803 family)